MSDVEVRVPDVGDFDNVDVIEVHRGPRFAQAEDPLITLETDKATMDVPAPRATGRFGRAAGPAKAKAWRLDSR